MKWIKLADEKPKCSGMYLTTNGSGILVCGYWAGRKTEWISLETEQGLHPTHWMELPPLPEMEEAK